VDVDVRGYTISQGNYLVVHTVRVDDLKQAIQQFPSVLCEEIDSRKLAFLKGLVGIEEIAQRFGVASDNFALP
jgi:hypothetical protein